MPKALVLYLGGTIKHIDYVEDEFPSANNFPAETIVYRPGHTDPWLRCYTSNQYRKVSNNHGWEVIDATEVPKEHRMWQLVYL